MDEWYEDYKFERDWVAIKELLGIIKHCFHNIPYAAALSILYYSDVKSFNDYGYTRSYKHDLYLDDVDMTDTEFFELIVHLTGKIPLPVDLISAIDYDSLEPISNDKRWYTSKSDWSNIMSINITDITIKEHK